MKILKYIIQALMICFISYNCYLETGLITGITIFILLVSTTFHLWFNNSIMDLISGANDNIESVLDLIMKLIGMKK